MRRLLRVVGAICLLSTLGCGDNTAALKALVGSYAVNVERADLPGRMDPDVMTLSIGRQQTMLLLFEVGISTDATATNPNGLSASLDGMSLKLEAQPVRIDYASGPYDGTLTGDGTIAPDGSSVSIRLHVVPTNLALPDGSKTFEYTVAGAKL